MFLGDQPPDAPQKTQVPPGVEYVTAPNSAWKKNLPLFFLKTSQVDIEECIKSFLDPLYFLTHREVMVGKPLGWGPLKNSTPYTPYITWYDWVYPLLKGWA